MKIIFDDNEFALFLSAIFQKNITIDELETMLITDSEWKIHVHCYYIETPQIHSNKLFLLLSGYTQKELEDIGKFVNRLKGIFEQAMKTNVIYKSLKLINLLLI